MFVLTNHVEVSWTASLMNCVPGHCGQMTTLRSLRFYRPSYCLILEQNIIPGVPHCLYQKHSCLESEEQIRSKKIHLYDWHPVWPQAEGDSFWRCSLLGTVFGKLKTFIFKYFLLHYYQFALLNIFSFKESRNLRAAKTGWEQNVDWRPWFESCWEGISGGRCVLRGRGIVCLWQNCF